MIILELFMPLRRRERGKRNRKRGKGTTPVSIVKNLKR